MIILGIDPGTHHSGLVAYSAIDKTVIDSHNELPNFQVLKYLSSAAYSPMCFGIEIPACYGLRVGRDVFQTCVWAGRFIQKFAGRMPSATLYEVSRPEIVHMLTGARSGPKAAVNAVLVDRFGPGRKIAVGKKSSPGPLYGVKGHAWDALAVAYYVAEIERQLSN
jgi:hypothetical protein